MNHLSEVEIQEKLTQGKEKSRLGDLEGAYNLFKLVSDSQPSNEQALIWRAAVCKNPIESISCLELALKQNPENKQALEGLDWARKRLIAINSRSSETQGVPIVESSHRDGTIHPELPLLPEKKSVKSETNSSVQPYKNSNNIQINYAQFKVGSIKPSELKGKKVKGKSRRKNEPDEPLATHQAENVDLQHDFPEAEFKLSDKVVRETLFAVNQGTLIQEYRIALKWPLMLFCLALIIAILSFAVIQFAPFFGIAALLSALVGVILFFQANF